MKKNIGLIFFLSIFSSATTAGSLCNSNVTRELEACAKSNFESSDVQLNIKYKTLFSKFSGRNKDMLINSQREWIQYKEKSCQATYDATNPGEEAGIEKWTCLDNLTKIRTKELQYLDSGSGMDEFFHAVDIVSKFYEAGDRNKFIDKLADKASSKGDPIWNFYIVENCKLAASRLHEEKKDCMARQGFYLY
ncbi:lysozyme inhibitor LprI family protein [Paraburkholderia sartisoli]|uniref:Lysozyme inhibitor LprI-like N-terminal domain-containing protein n=1 Tax=Paraburkholderia sartisoli TaxID=83784 RepID=A0A1H4FUB7_9BURK|nr:lysozyme inhibitor LprI family protein [Paraburkholderia sartisoli]SEB00741.1 Protein of unknown function [Paraburkholderia sartisoli]